MLSLLLALTQAPVAPKPALPVANELPRGFGYAVELCGDLDGDGRSEFAIGGRGWIGFPAGVLIYGGRDGNVLRRITTTVENEFIRGPMVRTGDLDGDHVDDLAVSIGSASGRVEICSGKTGAVLRTLSPIEGEVDFGIGLCRLGDVDADGVNDFVITAGLGAPTMPLGHAVSGADDHAVRWIVMSGAMGRRLRVIEWKGPPNHNWSLSRENPNAIVVGDVNADGISDFAIVDERIVRVESGASSQARRVRRVESGASSQARSQRRCSPLMSRRKLAVTSYRTSILGVPDADGDGRPDIIVGTPYAEPKDGARTATYLRIHSSASGKVIRSIERSTEQKGYGFALCVAPMKSADGFTEAWITSHDWFASFLIRTSLESGKDIALLRDPNMCDDYGYTLASGADVNGDGITDVIVGEYSQYDGGLSSCGGYVYSGKDGKLLWERVRDPIKAAKNREWLSK